MFKIIILAYSIYMFINCDKKIYGLFLLNTFVNLVILNMKGTVLKSAVLLTSMVVGIGMIIIILKIYYVHKDCIR